MILIAEDIIKEHLLTSVWAWLNGRCQFIYRQSLLLLLSRNKKINSIVCSPDPLVTDTRFFFLDFFLDLKKHWKYKSSFSIFSRFRYVFSYLVSNTGLQYNYGKYKALQIVICWSCLKIKLEELYLFNCLPGDKRRMHIIEGAWVLIQLWHFNDQGLH